MIICNCNGITEKKIVNTIKKRGARKLEHIQQLTGAATNCGRCIPVIDSLISEHEQYYIGRQLKLNL